MNTDSKNNKNPEEDGCSLEQPKNLTNRFNSKMEQTEKHESA